MDLFSCFVMVHLHGAAKDTKEAMHLRRLFHEMNTFEHFPDEAEEQIDSFVMKTKSQDGSSEERGGCMRFLLKGYSKGRV